VSEADVVVAVLWIGVTAYAVFGGAERGARAREAMDRAITPVWEANHTWLIFNLIVLWTAFPDAFAAIMTTLFVPLILAAFGIVLRGSGFAFRHVAQRLEHKRLFGATFALSSVVTPFFMGTAAGAIASGEVPAEGRGELISSWTGATSILIGVLFVAASAFIAAVFLVHDARREGDERLAEYFRLRALVSGGLTGLLAAVGLIVLHADARYVYDGLSSDALPLVLLSGLCGLGALELLRRGRPRFTRVLAVGAVVAVVWGWGVAQYSYLLPESLTVEQAAAPSGTLVGLLIVLGVAVLLVVPSIVLLFTLHERSRFE
jgi:cytochrome d ubiquinol oxidase subunit II